MSTSDQLIKTSCLQSNYEIVNKGLVIDTFGNVSLKKDRYCYIKPSGIDLNQCTESDISKVLIESSELISGKSPSTDTPTHLKLYSSFDGINGIVHTHAAYATAWAQSGKSIPCLGTTHADYWNGDIPITRELSDEEINGEYEKETGKVIIEKINELNIDPLDCPGILVAKHGPFTWGATVEDAVKHAELLEYIARIAWLSVSINPDSKPISKALLKKHYSRKHGSDAYYGQDSD